MTAQMKTVEQGCKKLGLLSEARPRRLQHKQNHNLGENQTNENSPQALENTDLDSAQPLIDSFRV